MTFSWDAVTRKKTSFVVHVSSSRMIKIQSVIYCVLYCAAPPLLFVMADTKVPNEGRARQD